MIQVEEAARRTTESAAEWATFCEISRVVDRMTYDAAYRATENATNMATLRATLNATITSTGLATRVDQSEVVGCIP